MNNNSTKSTEQEKEIIKVWYMMERSEGKLRRKYKD